MISLPHAEGRGGLGKGESRSTSVEFDEEGQRDAIFRLRGFPREKRHPHLFV